MGFHSRDGCLSRRQHGGRGELGERGFTCKCDSPTNARTRRSKHKNSRDLKRVHTISKRRRLIVCRAVDPNLPKIAYYHAKKAFPQENDCRRNVVQLLPHLRQLGHPSQIQGGEIRTSSQQQCEPFVRDPLTTLQCQRLQSTAVLAYGFKRCVCHLDIRRETDGKAYSKSYGPRHVILGAKVAGKKNMSTRLTLGKEVDRHMFSTAAKFAVFTTVAESILGGG